MNTIAGIVGLCFNIYNFLLLARIVITWLPHDAYHPLILRLKQATDPYLNLFKQLPLQFGGMDFSPIVALIVLSVIRTIVMKILFF